jgi:hypothetical protein
LSTVSILPNRPVEKRTETVVAELDSDEVGIVTRRPQNHAPHKITTSLVLIINLPSLADLYIEDLSMPRDEIAVYSAVGAAECGRFRIIEPEGALMWVPLNLKKQTQFKVGRIAAYYCITYHFA